MQHKLKFKTLAKLCYWLSLIMTGKGLIKPVTSLYNLLK